MHRKSWVCLLQEQQLLGLPWAQEFPTPDAGTWPLLQLLTKGLISLLISRTILHLAIKVYIVIHYHGPDCHTDRFSCYIYSNWCVLYVVVMSVVLMCVVCCSNECCTDVHWLMCVARLQHPWWTQMNSSSISSTSLVWWPGQSEFAHVYTCHVKSVIPLDCLALCTC